MTEFKRPKLDSQTYITLGYLLIVVIGMMFDYEYYNRFNINIFEYADILDFLLAPVKNLQLMIFAFGSFIVLLIFFRLDKLWMTKHPKTYKRFNFGMGLNSSSRYRTIMIGISIIGYLYVASIFYGERMFSKYNDEAENIEIIYESDQRTIKGKLIGKNTDYIFLEKQDKSIRAIPVNSDVQQIIISRP